MITFIKYHSHPLMLAVLVGMISLNLTFHILPETWHSGQEHSAILVGLALLGGLLFQNFLHRKLHQQSSRGFLFSLHLHNLSDGLIIGLAFLSNPLIGASATLAVVLHDLIHKAIGFKLLRNDNHQLHSAALNILSTYLTIAVGAWTTIIWRPNEELGSLLQGFAAGSLSYIVWLLLKRVLAMTEKQSLKLIFFLVGGLIMFSLTIILHHFIPELDH